MRIAVDCRFLSLSPSLQTRGIPRYIRQLLSAVLHRDRENDYLLLHRAMDDVTLLPAAIREAPNVSLHAFPGETSRIAAPAGTLRVMEALERWLQQQRIDLFHITAPWLPGVTGLPRVDACPVLATVYDLIPSLFAEHLVGEMRSGWTTAIEQLHRATRLLAISAHTARDLTLHLGIPADRIGVAYPHADACFRPLSTDEYRRRLAALRQRCRLPERFVMTVSISGFRNKNLDTLLDGYRRLPATLRRTLPLVVVGVQGPVGDELRHASDRWGVTPDVIATGIVDDDEVVALYNAATLVVCPSRYEGFGLPLVEAMQCGTPVLTTTAASMPEVTGGAAWLVDAHDPQAFAEAMASIAGDEQRRDEMRRAGLARATHFTPEALGEATHAAYQQTQAAGVREMSPTAPRSRRVAIRLRNPVRMDQRLRAALETADALAVGAEVDLFVQGDGLPSAELFRRFRVHDAAALDRIDAGRPYDVILRAHDAPGLPASWQVSVRDTPRELCIVAHDEARARIEPQAPDAFVQVVLPGVADPLGPQPVLQREQARVQIGLSTTSFTIDWPDPGSDAQDAHAVISAFADLCGMSLHAWLLVGRTDDQTTMLPAVVETGARVFGVLDRVRSHVPAAADAPPALAAATADAYLVAADVVIAFGDHDGLAPRHLLRAAAAGKVIVVREGDAMWLPDEACVRIPGGPSAGLVLGHVLRTLCGDAPRRAALGRAARAVYEQTFTLEHMRERLWTAFGLDDPATPANVTAVHDGGPAVGADRLGFNRVCNMEDFRDPELIAEMREVMAYKHRHFGPTYPAGVEHCKDWEVAMATRTLRHFGALHSDASILGVAAGMEDTLYYLTRHVREVVTIDRYAQAGVWQLNSPFWMLMMPELGAQEPCVPERLVVQHMDARRLRFPDDRFDGIFSSGSIEHFGGMMEVAHAAYEMGRVLKPGGILSLSTVISIAGPPDRHGVAGTCLLFQPEHIIRYIVDASGLELVDAFDHHATAATLAAHRPLEEALNAVSSGAAAHGLKGLQEDWKHGVFPCVVLDWDGVTFDSVHLALRKPLARTRVTNAWARPTPAVEAAIADDYRRLVEDYEAWTPPLSAPVVPLDRPALANAMRTRDAARLLRHHISGLASDIDGLRSEAMRHATRPDAADIPANVARPPDTWMPVTITQPPIPPFSIIVDRSERRDIISKALLDGLGAQVNAVEAMLIGAFAQPGDAVVDVGAHIGSITLRMAALGHRVLAVEASSRNVALLRTSVARNGFRDVTVVHAAASDVGGTIGFLSDGAWGWVAPPGEAATEYVPAVRIDDLVDAMGWSRVAVIKIDIEGSELSAIAGLSRLLTRDDAPAIYYESNTHTASHAGTTVGQVVAALEAHGYRNYVVGVGMLTRVYPDDTQDIVVRDHLAVKGALPPLPGLTVDERPRRR